MDLAQGSHVAGHAVVSIVTAKHASLYLAESPFAFGTAADPHRRLFDFTEFWLKYTFRAQPCVLVLLSLAFLGSCQRQQTRSDRELSADGDSEKTNPRGASEIRELLDSALRTQRLCIFVGSFPTDTQSTAPLFSRLSHLGVVAKTTIRAKTAFVLTKKGEESYDRRNQQLCYATPQLITIEDISIQKGEFDTFGKVTYLYKLRDVEPWALDRVIQANHPRIKRGLDDFAEGSAYLLDHDERWSVQTTGLQ